MSIEENFNFLEILSDIDEEYVREAGTEENAVQPQFIHPRLKRRKPVFAIAGIAACFALIFVIGIALSRNSGAEITQTLPPINTAVNTTEVTATETAETTEENHRIMEPQDNTKIDLFSSVINDAEGKEYELKLYMYHIDNGDDMYNAEAFAIKEGMLRGNVAAELLYNGERVFDQELVIGSVGQVAKSYYIPEIEDNFKVLHFDGGDVFSYAYSDDGELWFTQFYTIRDGKLEVMERYFSDEERKQIEEKTTGKGITPAKAKYEFITTNKFTTDQNRIIYELDFETSGMSGHSYEIGSYSTGEIPLIFDFENSTVRCEKEEYAGLVYSYFDVV